MREALDKTVLQRVYDRVSRRYDLQHGLLTANTDQRGRLIIAQKTVRCGDHVLDSGAGTGSTGLLAAERVGPEGKVVLFDLSNGMLEVAREKARATGLESRLELCVGDIHQLPFEEETFDAALSTYSMCPLYDPRKAALEMYRVLKPGGKAGFAHSAEPRNKVIRWLADRVEDVVWRLPSISLGCRSVDVLSSLKQAGARTAFTQWIGVPLWPFFVFVVEKPKSGKMDEVQGFSR